MEMENIFYDPINHIYPGGRTKFREEYPKLGLMNSRSMYCDAEMMNEIEYGPITSNYFQIDAPSKAYYVIPTKFLKRIERYGLANRLTNREDHIMLFLDGFSFDGMLHESSILEVELDKIDNIKVYRSNKSTTDKIISVFQNIPPIYIKVVGEVEVNPYIQ